MARRADGPKNPQGGVVLPPGGQVYVDPSVDPGNLVGAEAYKAGIMARRGGLPKQDMPLSPPRPPIPHIEGGPGRGDPGGHTMADYARAERAAAPAQASLPRPQSSIIAEAPVQAPLPKKAAAPNLKLAPTDLLTEQAKADPSFRQGYGAEFACNQPELAAKYGIIRSGQFIPPQKLSNPSDKSALRPETLQGLEQLKRLQDGQAISPGVEAEETAAREAVSSGIGGSAARVGGVKTDETGRTKAVNEEERNKALKAAISQMDAFEFNEFRRLTMNQILHSEEERELIESRLKPLDLAELLTHGVIRQRIPIRPGEYEITLQSYEGQVELALKRLVMAEARSVDVGEQYLLDKHAFMSVAVGLHKINDKP